MVKSGVKWRGSFYFRSGVRRKGESSSWRNRNNSIVISGTKNLSLSELKSKERKSRIYENTRQGSYGRDSVNPMIRQKFGIAKAETRQRNFRRIK